jgi:hypothetical protein
MIVLWYRVSYSGKIGLFGRIKVAISIRYWFYAVITAISIGGSTVIGSFVVPH